MFRAIAPALLLSLAAAGCAGSADDGATTDEAAAELSSKTGALQVTIKPTLTVTPVGEGFRYTLSGTTNRDLDSIQSFVPDDVFGEALLTGKRSFTVSLNDDNELNSVLSGLRLLVSFGVHGSTISYTAGLLFTPRFAARSGTTRIGIDSAVDAIWYAGQLAYRGKLHLTVTPTTVNAWTDQDLGPRIAAVSTRVYSDDWSYAGIKSGAVAGPVHFSIVDGAGKGWFRDADVQLVINELALTTEDPYVHWPQPTCAPSVQRCLDRLPYGSADSAACGSYGQVRRCVVTRALPALLPADGGTEIPALVDSANAQLTPPRHTSVAAYRYDWAAAAPPTIGQLLDGYVAFDKLAGATVLGAEPRTELDAALASWHLEGLPAALQRIVFIDRFETGKIIDGSDTLYILHVPEAGLLLVVTLSTT
jgi:hypothetical protein